MMHGNDADEITRKSDAAIYFLPGHFGGGWDSAAAAEQAISGAGGSRAPAYGAKRGFDGAGYTGGAALLFPARGTAEFGGRNHGAGCHDSMGKAGLAACGTTLANGYDTQPGKAKLLGKCRA